MPSFPKTSVTLLKDLAAGSTNVRWSEFITRYEPLMRGFLAHNFPNVEADDILQETFLALVHALPRYQYTPDGKGFFHDYLMGVVKHKALDALRRRAAESQKRKDFAAERDCHQAIRKADARKWQTALMNAAIEQLLADSSIASRNREIFRHTALLHERPEDVATQFGTTRGNVDVIKKRMIDKLSSLVETMSAVASPHVH